MYRKSNLLRICALFVRACCHVAQAQSNLARQDACNTMPPRLSADVLAIQSLALPICTSIGTFLVSLTSRRCALEIT